MKTALAIALAFSFATPVLAQSPGKEMKGEMKGPSKKEAAAAKKAAHEKALAAVLRKVKFPDLKAPATKKIFVAYARNTAQKEIQRLGLKGKSAKSYKDAYLEMAEGEHEIRDHAAKRHNELLIKMAKSLAKLSGKKVKDVDAKLFKLAYASIAMRPDQLRALRAERYEKDNAFTLLVQETGKTLEQVKDEIVALKADVNSDNPWRSYTKVNEGRQAFAGKLKNMFTPEQYFAYMEMKGIDKSPKKNTKGADRQFFIALRKLTLTDDQTQRIRALNRKKIDATIKREKIEEVLTKNQRSELTKLLGEGAKKKSKK